MRRWDWEEVETGLAGWARGAGLDWMERMEDYVQYEESMHNIGEGYDW